MNTAATVAAKMPCEVQQGNVELYKTNRGSVCIVGAELLGPKLVNILLKSIDMADDHGWCGINSIVVRNDNYPKVPSSQEEVLWMYYFDSRAVVCNISHCINVAFEDTLGEFTNFSVKSLVWKNIIQGFMHELHHAETFLDNGERELVQELEEARDKEEKAANEFARFLIEEVAKVVDVEVAFPPVIEDIIIGRYNALVELSKTDDGLKEWARLQSTMLKRGGHYYEPAEGKKRRIDFMVPSFREMIRQTSDNSDDPSWGEHVPVAMNTPTPVAVKDIPQLLEVEPFDVDSTPGFQGVVAAQQVITTEQIMGAQPAPVLPIAPLPPVQPTAGVPMPPNMPAPATTTAAPILGANAFPALNWDSTRFSNAVKSLYLRIYNHVFAGCGYNPAVRPSFTNMGNIASMLPLSEDEATLVKKMTRYNEESRVIVDEHMQGWISGIYMDKGNSLPGYKLSLTTNLGQEIRRNFLPQNPWKFKDGTNEYSSTALMAQQGHRIMWILDPDTTQKQYSTRIMNGVIQTNAGGRWVDC